MAETLVIGANGFISSHLVDSLVERGHRVRAYGHFASNETNFQPSQNIEVIAGDYLSSGLLEEAVDGVDYVFHFLSTTTPATAENDPIIDIKTNIEPSAELLRLSQRAGVQRVLFASSGGAIYGEGVGSGRRGSYVETDPTLPISPYGIGKLAIENYLRYFRAKHGLLSTSFRISNPYGERQSFHRKQGVIPIFLEKAYTDQPITVLGDGDMVRDYIYVKDLVTMLASVFDRDDLGEVYNIGSGTGTSINEIVDAVRQVTGKDPTIQTAPVPATFVNSVVLDTTKFSNEFGLLPSTGLAEGIRLTYDYIKAEIDQTGATA